MFKKLRPLVPIVVNAAKCLTFVRSYRKSDILSHYHPNWDFFKLFPSVAAPVRRFYKRTSILQSNGKFEISLDNRKLKTPSGSTFFVESEPLAIAVSNEWMNQKENIERSNMHLTSLCNTVIDNPNKVQKVDMINYMLNFIQTDTVLFHSSDEPRLLDVQQKEWGTIVEWFNKEFDTQLCPTTGFEVQQVNEETKMNISRYLSSYNDDALHGFTYAVDTLKSIVLAFACVKQKLDVETAVHYSRLEEEFQLGHWGRVEWAHDLSQQELQARLAAAIFFIYCNSSSYLVKQKTQ